MTCTQAELMISTIGPDIARGYHSYFDSLRPKTHEDFFRRGVFALASVHTTWQSNVALYVELRDLGWLTNQEDLRQRIVRSRAGMFNVRTRFFWEYAQRFWENPTAYYRKPDETWAAHRNRIREWTCGLGHAKSSFFLELTHFHDAEVVCLDTHMLQLYGYMPRGQRPSDRQMDEIEQHWLSCCRAANVPPVTARWIVWDRKQKRQDSRYWSHVLEE